MHDDRGAAFFDLDKTVIARASMVAMGKPLYREGLISRWLLLRALWGQLVYLWVGADETKLARMRDSVLKLTTGWDSVRVRAIAREAIDEVIEPIVYEEALALIAEHTEAGRAVFIVSASPEEIVAPLAEHLGVKRWIATRSEVDDDGRYTGQVEFYAYGPNKADAMREVAEAEGIDLEASYAYSDSATDEPMLACVGRPIAVNPDKELLRVARERDWEVRWFVRPVRLRDRLPHPAAAPTAAVGGGVMAAVGGVTWWWLRRDGRGGAPLPRSNADRSVQAARTFLAATAASVMSTRRRSSFFTGRDRRASGRSALPSRVQRVFRGS